MKSVGWEMRPAGWILLIVLALVLLYLVNQWINDSHNNPPKAV